MIEVLVNIKASKVPYVWAKRTSLENTDIEENIKSIKAIPTKILKNSESPKPALLLATNEKNISEIMKVIRISWSRRLNL